MLWQRFRNEVHRGSDLDLRIGILKITATIFFFSGTSCEITCHCLNNQQCNQADGSCPNGCAPGWQGPGCQIGNIAFNKPAYQSSTYDIYSADNAVNGITLPEGDFSISNCSHTVESNNRPHWWFVRLSETEDYVLTNITIVKRQNRLEYDLRNFYILYTNESTGQPNLTSWKKCLYYSSYQYVTEATYTCSFGTAIGRRVAVYLDVIPLSVETRKLLLCEVLVYGYSYKETALFRNTSISVSSNCDNIIVELGPLPVLPPTFLVVHINTINNNRTSRVERIRNDGSRPITVRAMANVTYGISVSPETCCIGSSCLNDNATFIESSKCVLGPSTRPVLTEMPQYQQYSLHKVGNTLSPLASGSSGCRSTNISMWCKIAEMMNNFTLCINKETCTLDPRHNYTCMLNVIYRDGLLVSSRRNITIETAEFSSINLTVKTMCNVATLSIEGLTKNLDIIPSSIYFTMKSSPWNDTRIQKILLTETQEGYKALFDVVRNTTYSVWAFPETCWQMNYCSSQGPQVCNTTYECINGSSTIVKIIKIFPGEIDMSQCMELTKFSGASVCEPVAYFIALAFQISVSVIFFRQRRLY